MSDSPSRTSEPDLDNDSSAPSSAKSVDVALAEFNALRAEVAGRISAQSTFLGAGLTALGLIAGFVVKTALMRVCWQLFHPYRS
jgi:hypothetical protein